jgi:hypothetical protein
MKAAIYCSHTDVWPIGKFVNHPKNPNRHSHEQIALLSKILLVHGWRRPIVVSSLSGMIVKGHGRLMAAKVAGLTEAPVEVQHYATTAEELADMVADNRIAELSEIDTSALSGLLDGLKAADFDIGLTGFSEKALASFASGERAPAAPEAAGAATSTERRPRVPRLGGRVHQYNMVFDDEFQQQRWLAFLRVLASRYPDKETIGDRLVAFIATTPPAPPNS